MSGSTSAMPGFEFSRKGNTWFMTANEPLSYEPAGSSEVTLSVVPTMIPPPTELLSPPPLPAQPASASATAAAPPMAPSTRRFVNADVIRLPLPVCVSA